MGLLARGPLWTLRGPQRLGVAAQPLELVELHGQLLRRVHQRLAGARQRRCLVHPALPHEHIAPRFEDVHAVAAKLASALEALTRRAEALAHAAVALLHVAAAQLGDVERPIGVQLRLLLTPLARVRRGQVGWHVVEQRDATCHALERAERVTTGVGVRRLAVERQAADSQRLGLVAHVGKDACRPARLLAGVDGRGTHRLNLHFRADTLELGHVLLLERLLPLSLLLLLVLVLMHRLQQAGLRLTQLDQRLARLLVLGGHGVRGGVHGAVEEATPPPQPLQSRARVLTRPSQL